MMGTSRGQACCDDLHVRVQFLQLQLKGPGDHRAFGGDDPDASAPGPGQGLLHRGDHHPQDPVAGVVGRR